LTLEFPVKLGKNAKMKTKLISLLLGVSVASGLWFFPQTPVSSAQALPPTSALIRANIVAMLQRQPNTPIQPLPDIPGPGGAPRATNKDAAYYAWQEFIAVNWGNVPVTGKAAKSSAPGAREVADRTVQFGQPAKAGTANYPALVWESTRHRSEIYTGTTAVPHGYVPSGQVSWGYNSSPGYVYPGSTVNPSSGTPVQPGINPAFTPFVNLDETSQIGLCTMYSGAPSPVNDPGNFVFFMAKGNYQEYGYIGSRGWYNTTKINQAPGVLSNTSGYIVINGKLPAPNQLDGTLNPGKYLSFPTGTMEFKAAFRVATAAEAAAYVAGKPIPGGYHAAPIRYYTQPVANGPYVYVDTIGVLLSLHIIHKTPSAPYFIFATFEHQDDVIGPDGKPTEDNNGTLNANAYTSTPPAAPPAGYVYPSAGTPPPGKYLINATSPNVFEQTSKYLLGASGVTTQMFIPTPTSNAGPISSTQSYYQNTRGSDGSTAASQSPDLSQSYLTVNRRRFSIPADPIISVNQDVHSLIAQYGYGGQNNVWMHYKLVNVQWIPSGNAVQKTPGLLYGDTSGGARPFIAPESYYLSNSLVETNMALSAFSGQFNLNAGDGLNITDFYFASKTYTDKNGTLPAVTKNVGNPFYNVYTQGGPYNMGGCMGCHGNTTVNGGSDASFILTGAPFAPTPVEPSMSIRLATHRSYFKR
jgi:hypothetical protein